jgi:hypothetical protein
VIADGCSLLVVHVHVAVADKVHDHVADHLHIHDDPGLC